MKNYSIVESAVIGGLGESPNIVLRALGFGAVILYIPMELISHDHGEQFKQQLSKLAANSQLIQNDYTQPHHQLNEASTLWSKFEVATIQQAHKYQIASSGYAQILMHIPMVLLNPYLGPELIQNELGLPYMAIDQSDQFKCMPIWYDDFKNEKDGIVDGNYTEYPGSQH